MKLFVKPRITAKSAAVIAVGLATVGLLLYRLAIPNNTLSIAESSLPGVHNCLYLIWHDPLQLPLTLARLLVTIIAPNGDTVWSRMPNVLLGLTTAALLYWLIKRWYGYRLALFGALMFATAPWFLHSSRLASTDALYPLGMTLLLVLAALWHQQERSKWLLLASVTIVSLLLYVPGMLWLILLMAWFERRNIASSIKDAKLHTTGAVLLGAIILVPMVHLLLTPDWGMYRTILGIPANMPSPVNYLESFIFTWRDIFIGGWHDPIRNVGGLPIVDLLTTVAFAVGIYLYSQHPKAVRTRELLAAWLIGTVFVAFHTMSVYLLLPIVLILSVGGIGYLLHLWLKVFPRNPVARSFGIGLIGVVILFSVAYNLTNYFVAWPNSPATQAVFKANIHTFWPK